MQQKMKFILTITALLLFYTTIGSGSATTHQITDQSYGNYFNKTGYINSTNIAAGDVLDLSGTISNKNMNIDRALHITSSDKTGKIVNGTITIYTGGSGSSVTDLTIENHNPDGNGIFLYETENVTVQDNHIYCDGAKGFAIPLTRSHHSKIIGNTVIMCGYPSGEYFVTHTAIPLGESNYNTIADNHIASDGANGIYLSNMGSGKFESNGLSYYNSIINNTIIGADTSTCVAIQMMGSHNEAVNNTILSQTFPEKKSKSGIGPYMGIGSSNDQEGGNRIMGNTISATNCGISVYSNGVVSGNMVFRYKDSDTNTTAVEACGIRVGSNCRVTNNTVNMINGGNGFYLEGTNSTISGNTVINVVNGYGFYLDEASNNTITLNSITSTDTTKGSIGLYSLSVGNQISKNTINSKNTGILFIKRSKSYYPENTTINGNKIITSSLYAVNSTITGEYSGTPRSIITGNYLVSYNGAKVGYDAVYSMVGDIVKDNTPLPATVTLTPGPGYYKNSLQVTLHINKNGTIYYTLNGTTPTSQSTPYNTPINVTKTTTLKFITVDYEGFTSLVQTKTYTIDTKAPTITLIDPANGAKKVAASKTIKVTFNEAIKAGNKLWVELKNSKGKAVPFKTSISGKVLTIDPASNLAESIYTLCIHTGAVTDLAGNPVALKNTKFSVGTAPTVSKIDPKNGATKVSPSKTIKVTFNENIKKGGKLWVELKNSSGKTISTTNSVSGKVLTVNPKSNLAESLYTLCIHTGAVTDLAGNPVALKTSKFSVGKAPTVSKVDPKNGATKVTRTKTIKVTFNENIKASSSYWIELVASNGSKIAIKKSISGKVLTIKHTTKLKANTKYKLVLHTGSVTDKAGNPIALKTINFTTRST